jgi:hypothetical protein
VSSPIICSKIFSTRQRQPVDNPKIYFYTNSMKNPPPKPRGRPAKDPSQRKAVDLRIPVTPEQKEIIFEATADEPDGMAAWARAVLLRAARAKLVYRGQADGESAVPGKAATRGRRKGASPGT